MRKFSILFFFLLTTIIAQSQKVKLGFVGESSSLQLTSTDPILDKSHYKALPVSMKKDEAVVFVMASKDFTPHLVLLTSNGGLIKMAEKKSSTMDGKEAVVSFKAPRDTSFVVIFSSIEENKTGNFIYTYKAPDKEQLFFTPDYSFCDRLNYLINHWQMYWEFIAKSVVVKQSFLSDNEPERKLVTDQTLVKGNKAEIEYGYKEELYNVYIKDITNLDFGANDPLFKEKEYVPQYNKVCNDILACLDKNIWRIEKEIDTIAFPPLNLATHFILNGAKKYQQLKSFTVYTPDHKPPVGISGKDYGTSIYLRFH